LQRLREEVRQLKQSVEAVTNASPEKLVKQILAYASRPLTEFNKYEVLEMLETLHNKAADRNHDRKNYYRLVHQSAREKVELSKDHFKDLVMRLLGDKDHERVLDIVSKVEKKSNRKKPQANDNRGAGGNMWCWEKSDSFDLRLQELQGKEIELPMSWVDCFGNPVEVSGEVTACDRHFKGSFKGELFDSDEPPMKVFKNNVSCKPFVSFVEETLVARLRSGAISLLGRVGVVDPPFIVLPLTVEPTKP
ncbi:unnamed protein product, partial [Porites lobata]